MSQLDFYTTAEEACEFVKAYEKVRDTVRGQHSLTVFSSDERTNFQVSLVALTSARVLMELSAALYTELPSPVVELDDEGEPYTENSAVNFTTEDAPEPFSPIGSGVEEDEEEDGDLEGEGAEDEEEEEGVLAAPKPGPRPRLVKNNGDKLPASISVE
jgi:hypothetical protein